MVPNSVFWRALWILFPAVVVTQVEGNHPPRLINFNGYATVKENSPIGTVIKSITAIDQDGPDPISFLIDPSNKETRIITVLNNTRGSSTTCRSVDIELTIPDLDRDRNPQERQLLFQVLDGTNNPVYARLTLFIEDVNDNAPEFRDTPYRATVKEDAPIGTLVFNGTSTYDPDLGLGSSIHYQLETKDAGCRHTFIVSEYQGVLYLNESLNYESVTSYRLVLRAIDGGGLISTTDVFIDVEDVQDTPTVATSGTSAPRDAHVVHFELMGELEDANQVKLALIETLYLAIGSGYDILVDKIQHRIYASGEPFGGRTDLTLYAVNKSSKQILSKCELLRLLQSKTDALMDAYKVYHVLNVWIEE